MEQAIRKIIREEQIEIKQEQISIRQEQTEIKRELQTLRLLHEESADNTQKILEVLSMLMERNDFLCGINSKVERYGQKIEINKSVLKKHIANKKIHLVPSEFKK